MGSTIISGIRSGFFSGSTGLEASLFLKLTGGTMLGPLILYGDPTLPLEAATKQYVDAHSKDHVSITLDMPSEFVVTGSPAAYDGTFTVALADQSPNMVLAGPADSTDPAAPPGFRALIAADISDLSSVTSLYLPLTGGTLTGPLTVNDDVSINGDLDATGILLNGSPIVASIFGRTGAVTAQSGDYTADLVTLSPAISNWTNVQSALNGIDLMLTNLSRGMSYVGSYDAANNIASFVTALTSLNGPLPAANAAGLHAGDFLICTSASATFAGGPVQVGDQIISDGSNWYVLAVGQAVITASMVPLSPVIRTWNTVQAAIQAISDGATQTPWVSNINANGYMLHSPAGVALRFGTNGTTERMRIQADGLVGIGRGDPVALVDLYRNIGAGVTPLPYMLRIAQRTSDGTDTNSNQLIRFEHNNGSNSRQWDVGCGALRFGNVDNFGFWDAYTADFPMMVIRRGNGWTSFGNNQDRQPSTTASHTSIYVGRSDGANHHPGRCVLIGNTTGTATYSGEVIWANYQIAVTEKRIGAISVNTGTTLDSGRMYLQTMDAGVVSAKVTILQDGRVGIGTTGPTARLHIHEGSTELDKVTCILARHLTDPNFQIVVTNAAVTGVTNTGGMKFGLWYNHSNPDSNLWNCGLRFWRGGSNGDGFMTIETSRLERMRFAANGNVGIGTSNPLRLLHVSGGDIIWDQEGSVTSPGPTLFTGTGNVNLDRYLALINSPNATMGSGLKASGILCSAAYAYANPGKSDLVVQGTIAVGAPSVTTGMAVEIVRTGNAALRLNGTNEAYISFWRTGGAPPAGAQQWQIGYVDGGRNIGFWSAATDSGFTAGNKATLTPAGNFGLSVNAPTHQLQLSTDSAGKPGTNTWTIVSDVRAKRNIAPFAGGMEIIRKLDPQVSEYNGRAGTPDGLRVVSLDPEKLREVVPGAVESVRGKLDETDEEETDILGVNTHEIFYHMLLAIQQLAKRLEKLES